MLADGCEARIRAQRPETKEALQEMIKDTIEKRVSSGQLDNTDLTLQDLDTIANTFTTTLRGVYHPRIEYPTFDVPTRPNPLLVYKSETADNDNPSMPLQSENQIPESEQSS
jgi:hypothetical protein